MANIKIYRPNWRRGGDAGDRLERYGYTQLLDVTHQQMCCLGQVAHQLGCPLESLNDVPEIGNMLDDPKVFLEGTLAYADEGCLREKRVCSAAMKVNDDESISDAERETSLALIFSGAGIAVEFVDDPAPWFSEVTA